MAADNHTDIRNTVLEMLERTFNDKTFSDTVLEHVLSAGTYQSRDRAFIRRLYSGVLERLIYIDNIIRNYSSVKIQKIRPVILNILRISIYQMLFMDSVPDFAAISEAVTLAGKRGFKGLKGYVNALLRNIQKDKDILEDSMPDNVRLSVPKWIYEMLCSLEGREAAEDFFAAALSADGSLTVRPNISKKSIEDIVHDLENEGCTVEDYEPESEPDFLKISGFDSLTDLHAFQEGLFSVQDESSIRAALTGCSYLRQQMSRPGNAERDLIIIDVCAAPGGKSICAAEEFPKARVIARDISEEKAQLIRDNARRLGLSNIEVQVHDALVADASLEGKADLVIADLPCSGLGVIGKKPDIKLRVRPEDIASLSNLQKEILNTVGSYVKPGGILVYSTCTFAPAENEENAAWIKDRLQFELLEMNRMIKKGADGFFAAVFQKPI